MSQSIVNSRELQKSLAAVMGRYQAAFDKVEELVKVHAARLEGLPPYVFAIDRLDDEQLALLPNELRQAEKYRRQERVALHCLVELIALEQMPGVDWTPPIPLQDPNTKPEELIQHEPEFSDGTELDRFISIMDFARRHGVIYLNGTFMAVEKHT